MTPDTAAAPPTRLEQLEATYTESLRKVHGPLLQQYLAELLAMQSKTVVAADSAALKAEIARVQSMIAGKGIIEFEAPKPDAPVSTGKPERKAGIVFSLDPDEATPLPANATAADASVPLGEATWRLSKLAAGNYDVIVHYTCPKLTEGAKLHVKFNQMELDRDMKPGQVTKDDKTFRVLKLGQLRVKEDELAQGFVITASPAGEPWLFVKQILIVKTKSE